MPDFESNGIVPVSVMEAAGIVDDLERTCKHPDRCLPRDDNPGDNCGFLFEARPGGLKIVPKREWPDLIQQRRQAGVDMRDKVKDILSQNGRGSCAAECVSQALMTVANYSGHQRRLLNPWSLYAWTSGGVDRGSNIGANFRRAREVGIMPMDVWPRSKGWRSKPSEDLLREHAARYRIDEFWEIRTREEAGSALLQNIPFVYGRRGHAITGIEMIDDDRFYYANSWNEWGENGFGIDRLSRDLGGYGMYAGRSVVDDGA